MDADSTLTVDPALLPDDSAVLKQLVVQLLEELHEAHARLERQEHHMPHAPALDSSSTVVFRIYPGCKALR
jgi:hypothetical protein